MLQRIPFEVGINERLINTMKDIVNNINPKDRYCALLFDDVSIHPNLQYNKRNDYIDGFVDSGNGRQREFADHATVFMLRGLGRKWKQPISYFLIEGTMHRAELAKNMKLMIRQATSISLHVLATMCDQGSVNIAAINDLVSDSRREFIRQGKEYRSVGFYIEGVEIIPIYDPSHFVQECQK